MRSLTAENANDCPPPGRAAGSRRPGKNRAGSVDFVSDTPGSRHGPATGPRRGCQADVCPRRSLGHTYTERLLVAFDPKAEFNWASCICIC